MGSAAPDITISLVASAEQDEVLAIALADEFHYSLKQQELEKHKGFKKENNIQQKVKRLENIDT